MRGTGRVRSRDTSLSALDRVRTFILAIDGKVDGHHLVARVLFYIRSTSGRTSTDISTRSWRVAGAIIKSAGEIVGGRKPDPLGVAVLDSLVKGVLKVEDIPSAAG